MENLTCQWKNRKEIGQKDKSPVKGGERKVKKLTVFKVDWQRKSNCVSIVDYSQHAFWPIQQECQQAERKGRKKNRQQKRKRERKFPP